MNDKLISKQPTKSDLLLAGWHEVIQDNISRWFHPKLNCGMTLNGAKIVQRTCGIDKMGELNV